MFNNEKNEKVLINVYYIDNCNNYLTKIFSIFFIFWIINFIIIEMLTENWSRNNIYYIHTFSVISILLCIFSSFLIMRINEKNNTKKEAYEIVEKSISNLMIFELLFLLFFIIAFVIPGMFDGLKIEKNPYLKREHYLHTLSYALLSFTVFFQVWFIRNGIYSAKKEIYRLEGNKLGIDEVISHHVKNLLFIIAIFILTNIFLVKLV